MLRGRKKAFRPGLGRKAELPRYHPNSRGKTARACKAPLTEGGRPCLHGGSRANRTGRSAGRLSAGDRPSLGGASRSFSRSSLISTYTYSTNKTEMQAPVRQIPPGQAADASADCQTARIFSSTDCAAALRGRQVSRQAEKSACSSAESIHPASSPGAKTMASMWPYRSR